MNTAPHQSLADALCQQDVLTPGDYAAHRLEVSRSLEKLKRRERLSRTLLLVLATTYIFGVTAMMLLDRVPREWQRQEWYAPVSMVAGITTVVAALGFPMLLLLYLLRHLPNWWMASRNRHELLLLQLIKEQRLANSAQQPSSNKTPECRPPE